MKKSVLITAGAIAFDLGVMVVAAHAAPTGAEKPIDRSPQAKLINMKYYLVKDGIKDGTVADEKACKTAGGTMKFLAWPWVSRRQERHGPPAQTVCDLPA